MDIAEETVRVRRLEEAIQTAIREKDSNGLTEHLAPDFVHLDGSANRQEREEFIGSAASSPLEILDIESDPLTIEFIGEVAIAAGVQRALVKLEDERRVEARTSFTDVFVRREGRWLLALAHSLDLGAVSPSVDFGSLPQ